MIIISITTWIFFCLTVGAIGSNKKIGFGGGFFISFFLSPIIGLIFVSVSKPKSLETINSNNTLNFSENNSNETISKINLNPSIDYNSILNELLNSNLISQREFESIKNRLNNFNSINSNGSDYHLKEDWIKSNKIKLVNFTLETNEIVEIFQKTSARDIEGCHIFLNGKPLEREFVKLEDIKKRLEINDGKVIKEYSFDVFTQKDGTNIEIDRDIYGSGKGYKCWIGNSLAPDGIYKTGMMSKVTVKDGVVQ